MNDEQEQHDDDRQLWRADDANRAELGETPDAEQTADSTNEVTPARDPGLRCDDPGQSSIETGGAP
jgi:hypothetical protein